MPSSVELASPSSAFCGVDVADHIVQGQDRAAVIVSATPPDGICMLPLSSNARLLMVTEPEPVAVHWNDQLVVPTAASQVVPPSVDTSTPTIPPTRTDAVPLIVTALPAANEEPEVGLVIVDVGATASEDGVAGVRPIAASWADAHIGKQADRCLSHTDTAFRRCYRSGFWHEPPDHCTVPALKTSARWNDGRESGWRGGSCSVGRAVVEEPRACSGGRRQAHQTDGRNLLFPLVPFISESSSRQRGVSPTGAVATLVFRQKRNDNEVGTVMAPEGVLPFTTKIVRSAHFADRHLRRAEARIAPCSSPRGGSSGR